MPQSIFSQCGKRLRFQDVIVVVFMAVLAGGCARVAGNYPAFNSKPAGVTARCTGEGFKLMAGSRLRLEAVEDELDFIKNQGFSRYDPQIIRSVTRRKRIPAALLTDQSGSAYYRFTARLDPGVALTLAPGALELTIETGEGTFLVRDHGFLLEDRRLPGGCRPPSSSTLLLGSGGQPSEMITKFLVRAPVKGKIVALAVLPARCQVEIRDTVP